MSEEVNVLKGGGGERGGDRGWVWATIMENCAIDHHLIIMRYLQKTFMIIADVIIIIIIIIIITVIITAALSSSCTYNYMTLEVLGRAYLILNDHNYF